MTGDGVATAGERRQASGDGNLDAGARGSVYILATCWKSGSRHSGAAAYSFPYSSFPYSFPATSGGFAGTLCWHIRESDSESARLAFHHSTISPLHAPVLRIHVI